MVDWTDWTPWKKLWDDWTRTTSERDLGVSHIHFLDLFNFFKRQVTALGIDPHEVDVRAYLDPSLTYEENKTILAEMMQVPPSTEEHESMYEEYKTNLENQVKEKYPEVWAEWEKQIKQLERETEALPREKRAKAKFKKLSEQLRYELEETEKRHEQEQRALAAKVTPVKLQILRDFREGITDYRTGTVIETRNIDWAMSLTERGLAERVGIGVEVTPPPKALTPDEIQRLEAEFRLMLADKLGRVPRRALDEFTAEAGAFKYLPYGEAYDHVTRLADRIVREEERAPKPPVAKRPPPEEIPIGIPVVRVAGVPEAPLGILPFPRRPSSEEKGPLWKAFIYALQQKGLNAYEYKKLYLERIENMTFKDWVHLKKRFNDLVNAIDKEEELPPLWLWEGIPVPALEAVWAPLPGRRPNAIVHFTTVAIKNARFRREPPKMEDLLEKLDQHGILHVTPEEIKTTIMEAWELKPKPLWFVNISLEELTSFLQET